MNLAVVLVSPKTPGNIGAAARVVQADAQARVAGAPLLPALDATGDFSYQRRGSSIVPAAGGSRYTDLRTYSTGLQVSYEVDFWGRNRALAEAELGGAEVIREPLVLSA